MKKLLAVLFILLLVSFSSLAFAQEISPTPQPSPSPTPVKYNLPYPGMLPDSPFYKLKVLRDKIMLVLIQDPMKKVEYHLLLADKRIQMAKILVNKGKTELAKETALKGENEYTLLVFLFKDVQKKPNKALFDKLELAALKHQEVLRGITTKLKGKDKKNFETVIEFSKRNADELSTIYNDN
ncbi:MAG: hypothetical protein A2953_02860 [Candidatus Levybacteria bacterium RIFCSPLOWO2_01_FULL_36_54]|nr:MAG: hypothetical protein A2953_02860 [Candidatus Levybacteria bacterium RIFCSPLOWO2_01_FULL_36_54]